MAMLGRGLGILDRAVAACLCLAAAAFLIGVFANIDVSEFRTYLPLMGRGLMVTLLIWLVTFWAGFCCAIPIAAALLSGSRLLAAPAQAFVQAIRFTPLLAQLYLVYFGAGELSAQLQAIGLWWLFADPMYCVLLVFTLNTAAYQAYIIANSIESVDKSQLEAARAFGMSGRIIFAHVMLPLGMMTALRPLTNELQKMVKASSIASVVTILDLLGTTKLIYSETLNFDFYVMCAVAYLAIVWFSGLAAGAFEARVLRHLRSDASGLAPSARPAG